jgi:hypothetical protein
MLVRVITYMQMLNEYTAHKVVKVGRNCVVYTEMVRETKQRIEVKKASPVFGLRTLFKSCRRLRYRTYTTRMMLKTCMHIIATFAMKSRRHAQDIRDLVHPQLTFSIQQTSIYRDSFPLYNHPYIKA